MADPHLHLIHLQTGREKILCAGQRFQIPLYPPVPGLVVVSVANEKDKWVPTSSSPKNNLFYRQPIILCGESSGPADDFNLWDGLKKFQECLPQELAQEFGMLVEEGMEAARCSLQMAWEAADLAALAVVMQHSSWLQTSGLSQEMQASI